MLRSAPFLRIVAASLLTVAAAIAAPEKIKVLIVDGQNNHAWATTTPLLKCILENAGRFTVDVSTTPPSKARPPVLAKDATPEQKSAHELKLKAYATEESDYKPRQ